MVTELDEAMIVFYSVCGINRTGSVSQKLGEGHAHTYESHADEH